jgi:hypothetical protein
MATIITTVGKTSNSTYLVEIVNVALMFVQKYKYENKISFHLHGYVCIIRARGSVDG